MKKSLLETVLDQLQASYRDPTSGDCITRDRAEEMVKEMSTLELLHTISDALDV